MGHNNESSQPERCHDSFYYRQPKDGDFIMSASAPFASSIFVLNPRASLSSEATAAVTKERRDTVTTLTARPPRGAEMRLNRSASMCNASATATDVVECNTTPHADVRQGESTEAAGAATTPAMTKSGHASSGTGHPRRLAPLAHGLQINTLAEGAGMRTAMSPLSAAGRMAYVADVTARVQRMRVRGRRAPEAAAPPGHSSAIDSEDGSPRSLNLPATVPTTGFHLPRLPVSSSKPKI